MIEAPAAPVADPAGSPEIGEGRLGPIRLAPGVRPRHVLAYVSLALVAVCITGFTPLMLPYLLTARLHLGPGQIGRVVGGLAAGQNLAIAALVLVFGAVADRLGRRRLLIFAYAAMALGVALYPLQPSLAGFTVAALLVGAGLGAQLVGGQTLGIDYPSNASRGLYLSSMLAIQLIGTVVIVGQIGVRLPGWAMSMGAGAQGGQNLAFWFIAALGAPALALVLFGLKPESRPALSATQTLAASLAEFRELFGHARRNGGFQLALLGAMTVRGDLAVVATFLALSVAAAARAHGIEPATAARHAGAVYSFVQGGSLVGAMTMGLLLDRFDRRKLLLIGLGVVSIALLAPLLVRDAMGNQIYLAALVMGLAEGGITVPTSALLGQEAPAHLRGKATSVFILLGVLSVAGMNLLGGMLFDRFGVMGPFLMSGALNAAILVRGLFIVRPGFGRAKPPSADKKDGA